MSSYGGTGRGEEATATASGEEGLYLPPAIDDRSMKLKDHLAPALKSQHYVDYINQAMDNARGASERAEELEKETRRHETRNQEQFFSRRLKDSLSKERNIKTSQEHRSRVHKLKDPLIFGSQEENYSNGGSQP